MFWKKKNNLPITENDKEWVNENLYWLKEEFGAEHFLATKTIKPTKEFYNRNFDGSEQDAEFILKRTMELMDIQDIEIILDFFSDRPIQMSDGTILTTTADINGKWESATGTYQKKNDEIIISIETQQLADPISLIATISHELSHQILLGEYRIDDNDEYLTDLTAINYGFGIFIGNSRFKFNQFSTTNGSGWQSSTQGYLPEQIIAYTMAKLSKERKEDIGYIKYLNKSLKKYFEKSYDYLNQNEK